MAFKRKTTRTMIAVVMTVMLVLITAAPVFAANHPIVDFSKKGSITMTHKAETTGDPIQGSTMVLYKVAKVVNQGGDPVYQPVDGLDPTGNIKAAMNRVSESDAGAFDLAKTVEALVKEAGISGDKKITNGNGQIVWDNLDLGMYLIVNEQPAEGYEKIPSFLITVPRLLSGAYVYDVVTEPKPAPAPTKETETTPTETETESQTNTNTTGSTTSTDSTTTSPDPDHLPQTGQTWWPVPVLCLLGIVAIGIGVYRRKRS